MATIFPLEQRFIQLTTGWTFGIHRVRLVTVSDTFEAALPASHTSANISAAQLRDHQDPAVTVTQSGGDATVTVAGSPGNEAWIVTLHRGILDTGPAAVTGS